MSLHKETLHVAMELSKKNWKLAFGDGNKERFRSITAKETQTLFAEVEKAREKFGLPADAPVVFCYEAGRDGFWIYRMLVKKGYDCDVMDPSSIEVSRRARQRKTDRLDAKKLLDLLIRSRLWGQKQAYSVVRVPSEEQESDMRLYRERDRLMSERTGHRSRIRSLLALHGIEVSNPLSVNLDKLKDWDGKGLSEAYIAELTHEQERLRMVEEQLGNIEKEQARSLKEGKGPAVEKARRLYALKAVGTQTALMYSHECFGWRTFANRKKLGSFLGLTGTPYDSGNTLHEQGISKSGSKRLRTGAIELAWCWVRWQKQSALTKWFETRYGQGTKRDRRKGIVALARKLIIALWKYLEQGIVPEGAIMKV